MGKPPIEPVIVVQPGKTRIGDVYCPADHPTAGRRPIVGYFDLCAATAYVVHHEIDTLCDLLGAERRGHHVRVPRGHGYVEYATRPLEELDYHAPVQNCDMAGLADFECRVDQGCIPLIDVDNGAPAGSIRSPKGTVICTKVPGARCVEILTKQKVDLYANQDCTPDPPTTVERTFALCSIT